MIYSYIQENEEKFVAKKDHSHFRVDLQKFEEVCCQNYVVVNGVKMTIQEFRDNTGGNTNV